MNSQWCEEITRKKIKWCLLPCVCLRGCMCGREKVSELKCRMGTQNMHNILFFCIIGVWPKTTYTWHLRETMPNVCFIDRRLREAGVDVPVQLRLALFHWFTYASKRSSLYINFVAVRSTMSSREDTANTFLYTSESVGEGHPGKINIIKKLV